jgi:hypothetical protein
MMGLDTFGTANVPAGAPPPVVFAAPATVEPRAIEESDQATLGEDADSLSYNSSRAMLQLVQRSAEDFAALVTAGQSPGDAAALTGTPDTGLGRTGSVVDEYA